MYVCVHACMHAHVCMMKGRLCMCVCMYVCMMKGGPWNQSHTYMHAQGHAYTPELCHQCKKIANIGHCMRSRRSARPLQASMRAPSTCIHMYIYTYIYIYIYIYIYTAYMCMYTPELCHQCTKTANSGHCMRSRRSARPPKASMRARRGPYNRPDSLSTKWSL